MKKQGMDDYFCDGHLNDQAMAMCAEALVFDKEGELSAVIRNHVADCDYCQDEIFFLYDLIKDDEYLKEMKVPQFFDPISGKKMRFTKINILKIGKIAAIFLLLVGFTGLVGYIVTWQNSTRLSVPRTPRNVSKENKMENKVLTEHKKDLQVYPSVESVRGKSDIAANMQESEIFEALITVRHMGTDITVLSPVMGQQFPGDGAIVFKFGGNVPALLRVKVYNNKDQKIVDRERISVPGFTLDTTLLPGLYYWKIECDRDILYAGKFVVSATSADSVSNKGAHNQ
jgi:hypothetical protein